MYQGSLYLLKEAKLTSKSQSESGWPHQGDPNNKAIPSPENQAAAIASLKAAFGGGSNLVLYNSYNDLWKSDSADTFGSVFN